ncbi:MAG TPA: signal peptidase II [Gaiellaceae bacterium]|nr:signal peptidase II [Gaiellaceae bacterium]
MSEPARTDAPAARPPLEIRVGSATNALQPVSSAKRSLAAGPVQWVGLLLVAGAAIAADQITKQVVSSALPLGDEVAVAGPFSIHHVQNSGIAFGLFSSATAVVIAVTTLAVALMLAFFAHSAQRHPMLSVALGLVLGGSVSNLLDRVRLGYVTDFLDFDRWPAFNLADTFIVVGVALLFVSFVAADRTSPRVGNPPLSRL